MIVGDPNSFAIESGITRADERLSLRAVGFFVIHVGGRRYGVHAPDATWLACSFDEVQARFKRRGSHTAPFACEQDAGRIADAYRDSKYAPGQENEVFFGIPQREFSGLISTNHIAWAPDGDAAFDDGSHVLHFDVGSRVRLIAFRSIEEGYHHDPATLGEVWLGAGDFYPILQEWCDKFEETWSAARRISDSEDGKELNA